MCNWLYNKNQLLLALLLCVSTVSFGQRIFWAQDGTVNQVRSANLDGTNIQTHFTDTDGPIRISVDRINNILFYLTQSPNVVKRRNLSTFGSEIAIYDYPAFTAAYNLAHHPGDQQIYINGFVDSDDARIERSNYTDQDCCSFPENLDLGTLAEFGNFFDVAVDTDNEQVYVSYEPLGTIYYRPTFACCAAATPTQILSGTAGQSFGIDLGSRSIIYENAGNTISAADMDTGGGQTLLNTGFTNIEAIDVTADGRIVVLDGTTVKVMESDGSGLTQVLSGLTSATDVSVMACGDPTTQVSGLTAAAASQTAIDLNWTNGNGDRTIILAREGSTIADQPRDGITYSANSSLGLGDEIGTGTFVIYNGTATTLQVTGLTAGTEYFFEAFSYDTFGNCYRTFSPAAANTFTQPSGPYSSVQNGDWEDPATWDFGVPVDGSDVIINHVVNGSLVSNELNNLTINASGNYQALSTLSVTGDLTNNGGVFSPSTGSSVNFIGTDHTLTGDFNFAQVTFNHTGTVQLNGDMSASLYGLVGNSGTLDANGFTIVSSENWQMFGTVFIPSGGLVQHTEDGIFGTNGFEPSGASTFFDLEITVNNSTTLSSESLFIENSLTVNPGDGTGTFRASNGFEIQGDMTVNGTLLFGTGSVTYSGANIQTLSGTETINAQIIDFNKTGGQINLNTDLFAEFINLGSTIIVSGGGTVDLVNQPGSVTTGYIQGPLRFRVDLAATYTFPLGANGNQQFLEFTLENPSIVYPTIEFVPTDPGANGLPLNEGTALLSQQFTEGYWRVELSTDPGNYSLNATTTNISSVAVDGDTRLLSRSDTGQPWTLNGTHVTGDGTFIQRDGLSGTVLEVSGVAGCTDPATQASGSAIANLSGTSVDLSWTNGDGSNRIVLAEQTANIAVSNPPLDGTAYTANATFGSGDLIGAATYVVYNGTGNSFTLNGLTPGLDYVISIFEYNTPPSFCYNIGIGGSNSINFITPSEYSFTTQNSLVNLSSLQDTQAEALAAQPAWEILFNGTGAFLEMDSWSITQGAGNAVADWTTVIAGAELVNVAQARTEVGTITPTSIDFTLQQGGSGSGRIRDGEVYELYIWLNSSLPATADLQNLVFELDEVNVVVSTGNLVPGTTANSGATNNMIDIIGTSLSFTQQPTDTQVDQPMTPDITLEALDENGNLDLDITGVNLTSSGTMTGDPLLADAVSGIITFSGITHTVTGSNLQLTASSAGTTDAVSSPFNITAKPEPLEHVTGFTVDNVGLINIDLSWVESTNPQLAEGYLLMGVLDGSAFPAVTDGTPVADDALLSDGFSAINLPAGTTTYTFPDALPAVTYDFIIYPFTNSGTEIDYKTDGTMPEVSATTLPNELSDIIINPAFTPVASIDYINFTQADVTASSFLLGSFEIRDGGASGDLDLVPTILQDIGFTINGPVNRIALYDSSTELGETLAGSPSFSGLNLTVPDDGSVILDVYCTFNTTVTDGVATSIALNPGSVTTSPGNSGISPLQAVVTATNGNISVVATEIIITQQPSTAATQYTALAQQPVFQAVDANGNLDTDFNETFVVGTADPDDLQPVSPPTAFNAGVLDFAGSGFNFEAVGTSTMHVLTDGTSLLSPSTTAIVVTASPVFITSATPTASTFCVGGDGTITVDGVNPGTIADYTFELYQGTDQSTLVASPGPTFTDLPAGLYNIIGTNINSGASTPQFDVSVSENSVDPVINTSGVANTGCTTPNGSITLDIDGGADPANYTIDWFVGSDNSVPLDPAKISADRLIASELEAQDYYIEVTNNLTGCMNSNIRLVPSAFVIIDATLGPAGPFNICQGQSATLQVNISGGTGPYTVELDDGTVVTSYNSGDNITVAPTADITYGLVAVTEESSGCTASLAGAVDVFVGTPPTVTINTTGNTSCGIFNGAADLTVSGSSGSVNYELQDDTGAVVQNVSGSENQSFTDLAAGIYTVIIEDAVSSCQITEQFTIDENADVPVAFAGGDATICEGESVTLTGAATGGDGNYSFNWTEDVPGSISDPTTQNQTVSPTATTTYTLVVTDGGGCVSADDQVIVTVNPAFQSAELVASGPTTICQGETTTLQVNLNGGSGPYSISLSNGQTLNSYTAGTDISISPAITSAITLQAASDNNSCTVQNIIGSGVNIIVDEAPSDASTGPDDTTCDATYPNLGGNTPASGTGIWTTTSGATITNPNDPNTSVSNLAVGANEFTWTISSGSCTETSDESIIITRESAPVSSSGASSINGPTSLCSDAQGQTYSVTGVTGATSFEWTLPNGFSATSTTTTDPSITVNLDQAGSGTINVVAINSCGSLTISGLDVNITPAAQVTLIAGDAIKQLQPTKFSYNSTARLTRTNWTFGDGSSSGEDNPEHTYTSSGSFTVTLDYVDEQGCTNSVTVVVQVSPLSSVSIKNAVTPNGDDKNDVLFIEGIEDYPSNSVTFLDRWGVEIIRFDGYANDWDMRISGSLVPAGNYLCIVELPETGEVIKRTVTVVKGN